MIQTNAHCSCAVYISCNKLHRHRIIIFLIEAALTMIILRSCSTHASSTCIQHAAFEVAIDSPGDAAVGDLGLDGNFLLSCHCKQNKWALEVHFELEGNGKSVRYVSY